MSVPVCVSMYMQISYHNVRPLIFRSVYTRLSF